MTGNENAKIIDSLSNVKRPSREKLIKEIKSKLEEKGI